MITLLNTELVTVSQDEQTQKLTFLMDKNSLKSIPKISNDPFFSNESNWESITLVYKHSTSKRRFTPSFRKTKSSLTVKLKSGMSSGDNFQLRKIIISDVGRQVHITVKRGELEIPSFYDFQLNTGSSSEAQPPQTPQNISVSLTGFTPVINFNSSLNATSYKIYRGTSANDLTLLTTVYSNSHQDSSAVKNQTYHYAVKASNGLDSALSQKVSVKIPVSSPSFVSQNVGSNGRPMISWTFVLGATSYKIFRGLSANSITELTETSDISFLDSSAEIGITYFYAIKSFNGSESPETSSVIESTPIPSVPQNFEVSLSEGLPVLSWTPSLGAVYKIFRGLSLNSLAQIDSNISDSQYLDSSAIAGNTYYYSIVSEVSGFSSQQTQKLSISAVLLAPSNLIVNLSEQKPALSWSSVNGATSYDIYGGDSLENLSLIGNSQTTEFIHSSAPAGFLYYQVKASSSITSSEFSNYSEILVPTAAPNAPLITATEGSSSISWDACEGALSYKILRGTEEGNLTVIASDITDTSYIDSTVIAGVDYYYAIKAFNGLDSTSSESTYVNVPLSAPSIMASAITGQVTVNWGAIEGALSYKVFRGTSSGNLTLIASAITQNSYVDTDVQAGTTYFYAVKSYDQVDSALSSESSATTPVAAPSNLSVSASSSEISLSWNAVSGAASYKLYRGTSSGSLSLVAENIAQTSYLDSSVFSNVRYYYAVKSFNGTDSILSSESSILTPTEAPSNLAISLLSNKPSLSWDAVSGAIGSTAYRVYRGTTSGSLNELALIPSNEIMDGNALDGQTYYYAIKAYNGSLSAFSSEVMIAVPSRVPQNLVASASSGSNINLSWTALSGASYTYKIYRGTSADSVNELIQTTGYSANSFEVTDGSYGTTYYFAVSAVQENQESAKSSIASVITTAVAPVLSSLTQSGSDVLIDWNDVLGAANYVVFRGASSLSLASLNSSSESSYTDSTTAAGSAYSYAVKANNGTYSDSSNVKNIKIISIASPNITSSSPNKSSLSVSWDSVVGADSYDFKYKKDIDAEYTTISSAVAPITLNGLDSGEAYNIKMVSKNNIGDGNSVESSVIAAYPTATTGSPSITETPYTTSVSAGSLNNTMAYNHIAYGAGRFLSVHSNLTRYNTSADGSTWGTPASTINSTSTTSNNFRYTGGYFLAPRNTGYFRYSTDGITWSEKVLTQTSNLSDMASNGISTFVGVATANDRIICSTAGVNGVYATIANPNAATVSGFNAVAYGGGKFVTISNGLDVSTVATEVQKISWVITPTAGNFTLSWGGVNSASFAYNSTVATIQADLRVKWGLSGLTVTGAINSTTGLTITFAGTIGNIAQLTIPTTTLNQAPSINTTTQGVSHHNVAYSINGTTWSTSVMNGSGSYTWGDLTYGNSKFMAVGGYSSGTKGAVSYSTDGITWTTNSSIGTSSRLLVVAFGGGVFAAADATGIHYSSNDGVSWTSTTIPGIATITSPRITYGGGKFVLVCNQGVASSSNGSVWVKENPPTTFVSANTSSAIAWDGTYFHSHNGSYGMISSDGINWSTYNSSLLLNTNSMACGNGYLAAAKDTGYMVTSNNVGKTWTYPSLPLVQNIQSVTYGPSGFVAVANTGYNRVITSSTGAAWTYRVSANENKGWKSVTYGNGMYFAVGDNSTSVEIQQISFSSVPTAGAYTISWNGFTSGSIAYNAAAADVQTALTTAFAKAVTVTGASSYSLFVSWPVGENPAQMTVGTNTTGKTITITTATESGNSASGMRSTNGIDWTLQSMGSIAQSYNSITYGGGQFVAVGDAGAVAYSSNGTSWTSLTLPSALNMQSVAYGAGLYVAVASTGTNRILTSPDGITWTNRASPDDGVAWNEVIYANNKFVIVGASGGTNSNRTGYSLDGINWSFGVLPSDLLNFGVISVNNVAVNGENFLGVSGGGTNYILNDTIYPTTMTLRSVAYGKGLYVAAVAVGSIRTSADGINWTPISGISLGNSPVVSYTNGMFFITDSSTTTLRYSSDGLVWNSTTCPSGTWKEVVYAFGTYFCPSASSSSYLMKSTDGITWTNVTLPSAPTIWYAYSMTYGKGVLMITGDSNTYYTSTDGVNWTKRSLPESEFTMYAVKYKNGLFFGTSLSKIYYSQDGINWSSYSVSNISSSGTSPFAISNTKVKGYSSNNTNFSITMV